MQKKTYVFHEAGVIPGIPGSFPAGVEVDIDLDTMTVVGQRFRQANALEVADDSAQKQSGKGE